MAMTQLGACVVIAAGACAGSPGRPQPPRTGAPSAVPRASERCYAGFVETVHDQRMPVQLRWRLDPEQRQLVEEWVDVRKTRTVYRVVLEGEEASAIAPNGDGGVLVGPPWAWTRFYTRGLEVSGVDGDRRDAEHHVTGDDGDRVRSRLMR